MNDDPLARVKALVDPKRYPHGEDTCSECLINEADLRAIVFEMETGRALRDIAKELISEHFVYDAMLNLQMGTEIDRVRDAIRAYDAARKQKT